MKSDFHTKITELYSFFESKHKNQLFKEFKLFESEKAMIPAILLNIFKFSIIYEPEIKENVRRFIVTLKSIKNYKTISNNIIEYVVNFIIQEINTIIEKTIFEEKDNFAKATAEGTMSAFRKYIAHKYQELDRLSIHKIIEIFDSTISVLVKLDENFTTIDTDFKTGHTLQNIELLGDVHNNGQRVCILTFSEKKIVYKPRRMDNETLFYELCSIININSKDIQLPLLKIKNYNNFSVCEFIENIECEKIEDIKYFYKKAGGILFVSYLLNAKDLHYENIIASGNKPYLVDLECILYNPTYDNNKFQNDEGVTSLLTTGLLPLKIEMKEDIYVEFGGLTKIKDEQIPIENEYIEYNANSLIKENRQNRISSNSNLPKFKKLEYDVTNYFNEIKEGFELAYHAYLSRRNEFLATINRYIEKNELHLRILIRPTPVYSHIKTLSLYPEYLINSKLRQVSFLNLCYNFIRNKKSYNILKSEFESLRNINIPYFYCLPNSRHLYSETTTINNFSSKTPAKCLQNKLNQLNIYDLNFQLKTIDKLQNVYQRKNNSYSINRKQNIAEEIANIIYNDIYNKKKTFLIIDKLHFDDKSVLKPISFDLYSGYSGLLLYFTAMYATFKHKNFRNISYKIYKKILVFIDEKTSYYPGFYSGLGGVIYSLSYFYEVFKEEKASLSAFNVTKLNNFYNTYFDLMYGIPGYIIGLHKLLSTKYDSETEVLLKDNIKIVFDHIENQEITEIKQLSFSHGYSGVLYSLTVNYNYLSKIQKDRFLLIFNNYTKILEDLYLSENYPTPENHIANWCNSEIGIALSYIKSCKILKIQQNQILIDKLDGISTQFGFGDNHSLCHGDSSFLELQQNISKMNFKQKLNIYFDDIYNNGLKCGNESKLNSMGLMTGIAGIGYQILHFQNPELVPNILLPD